MTNLTYVLRARKIVTIERHTVTHKTFHRQSDTGLAKLETWPAGGGIAEAGWEVTAINKDTVYLWQEG